MVSSQPYNNTIYATTDLAYTIARLLYVVSNSMSNVYYPYSYRHHAQSYPSSNQTLSFTLPSSLH